MARSEITGRKVGSSSSRKPPVTLAGKTINQFCASWQISRSTYNNMRKAKRGPAETRMADGGAIRITPESEEAWARANTTSVAAE